MDGCTVRAIDRLPASIHAGKQASLAVKAATKLTKESQKALLKAPGRRGETLTVTIKAKYGGYTPMEVVKVCDAIKAGDIKRTELKRTEYSPPYKYPRLVPKSTVEMYLVKDPKTQQPKYEALRGRLTMPPKEQPLLTEKVDTFLQLATFWAHRARLPFRLSNPELIAFILAREGKQPTNKQKASMVTLAMTVKNKPVTRASARSASRSWPITRACWRTALPCEGEHMIYFAEQGGVRAILFRHEPSVVGPVPRTPRSGAFIG